MARLLPLDQCLQITEGILFDTASLFDLLHYEETRGETYPQLLRIEPTLRYTSIINVFEFMCGDLSADVVRARRAWLDRNGFKHVRVSDAVSITFQSLARARWPREWLADFLTAATAKARNFALASSDGDFEHMDGLVWVAEFILQP